MIARQIFISTFLVASTSTIAVAVAQQQPPATPPAPQQRRTAMLGTKPREFYLEKITVSDLPKSYEFYTKVIGLKWATAPDTEPPKAPTAGDPEKDFVEIPLNFSGSLADPIFVLVKQRGNDPSPEFTKKISVGFKVPSAREALVRAAQAGYKSTRGDPGEGPMAFGFIADPDGYIIEFVQAPSYPEK
jgi:catechol 2,3-dioxygenase-like lactoylglutathione lyase family enzyme